MTCELQLNMLNYHEGSAQATSKIFGIPVTLLTFPSIKTREMQSQAIQIF